MKNVLREMARGQMWLRFSRENATTRDGTLIKVHVVCNRRIADKRLGKPRCVAFELATKRMSRITKKKREKNKIDAQEVGKRGNVFCIQRQRRPNV